MKATCLCIPPVPTINTRTDDTPCTHQERELVLAAIQYGTHARFDITSEGRSALTLEEMK